MNVTNPATGETIGEVADTPVRRLSEMRSVARASQSQWRTTPIESRIDTLQRFRSLLMQHLDDLARTLTSETGKPITQARSEIQATGPRIDFFLESVAGVLGATTVYDDGSMREVISTDPLGLVANISAWNYPYFVGTNVFVPALLTGNAVLYKPSEFAALTGAAISDLLATAGLPEGLFTLVQGGGEVGAALLDLELDGVFFTGSYATGRRIAEQVAGRLTRVQLELGGKDPVYVADDVDPVRAAVSVAEGAFYNSGQSCCAVERVYVHQSIYDQFVDAFVAEVESFTVGDPYDTSTFIGPLTRPAQLDVLKKQVTDAIARGGRVLTGGKRVNQPGSWFEPTVIVDATQEMSLMRDETFGPLIGLSPVSSDAEATALMNDTAYGLTAGVFSTDEARARAVLRQVNAGTVYWNCCDRVSPRLPWSGRGQSGIGTTLGLAGIEAFTQPKAWHLNGSRPAPPAPDQ